jgi:esterase/lipase
MTTLYLHGLNSTNVNDRTRWLSNFGKVVNPLMHYRNYPENYKYLEKLVQKYHPDVIVGSSMGGYMAFHLGNYFRIPTILLNPALIMTTIVKLDNRLWATDAKHYISLGKNDEVIPPDTTKKLLKYWQVPYQIYEFDIGHETPFEVFEKICINSNLFQK